ncbi:cobalt-precorrin 5A hydrolase [Anoxybacterium hadale]|uniref:cobalt-precorrin 5A hydrolase n=1 Tax=Anoxybacterium hadale TaxID=3408580 RepID=UPI003B008E1E
MNIAIISFTKSGAVICRGLKTGLNELGHSCDGYGKAPFAEEEGLEYFTEKLDQWTKTAFETKDAILFVGACGIAVRSIAPYIRNKAVDPAVIVIDEKGHFAISLLSGHLGGANELTRSIAQVIGAVPVITTATDLNGCFAVDEWAKKNRLKIGSMDLAKDISAALLRGETVGVVSDYPIEGTLPDGLVLLSESLASQGLLDEFRGHDDADSSRLNDTSDPPHSPAKIPRMGFRISLWEREGPFEKTLHLIPAAVTLGIGCRKGVLAETAEEFFYDVCKEHGLSTASIERLCSIDLKKEEHAINQLARRLDVPIEFYPAEELSRVPGEFTASEFVASITGVDNVCERAAVLGGHGELIIRKQSRNGVTIAAAVRKVGYQWIQE